MTNTTIRDILAEYGYTQTGLSLRFGIPLRTVQDWCSGARTPPAYVVRMMLALLDAEKAEK